VRFFCRGGVYDDVHILIEGRRGSAEGAQRRTGGSRRASAAEAAVNLFGTLRHDWKSCPSDLCLARAWEIKIPRGRRSWNPILVAKNATRMGHPAATAPRTHVFTKSRSENGISSSC
jgi:hypothetical protein